MKAEKELWNVADDVKIWVGKYKNSHNLPHWHDHCELVEVEYGQIDIVCGKKNVTLQKGNACFIPGGELHYMHACIPDSILTVIIFDYDIIKPFTEGAYLAEPNLKGNYPIEETYAALKEVLQKKEPFYACKATGILLSLIADIFHGEKTMPEGKARAVDENFKKLLSEIDKNYEFIDFESAAAFMGMNQSYFSRFFHGAAGISFSQYLNSVRVKEAVTLLQSDERLPVTEIASRSGFSTIRNFNRIFKEMTGYSPSALPADYVFNDAYLRTSLLRREHSAKDPTLSGCELIESSDEKLEEKNVKNV
jgi:xylan 1,4-beta-xylosidase